MMALSPTQTSRKALNPSAPNYLPLHHTTEISLAASKLLLPPPHLNFFHTPCFYPPPHYYLFHAMPELHQIVWAPVVRTHVGCPPKMQRQRRRVLPPRLQVWRRKCGGEVAPALEKRDPLGNRTTTVMIRNIPNRLRQPELVSLLAEHCSEMNKTRAHRSEFDLVYLPVDFKRLGNKGYAFVNFTSASGAAGLYHAWNNLGWKNFDTKKTRLITTAAIQGKDKLKERLERSSFDCDTDEYLAVELTPACNGWNLSAVTASTVGRRVKAGQPQKKNN